MAIWAGSHLCLSFKRELFEAKHDFLADTFHLALYTDHADLQPSTVAYLSEGEVPPLNGYASGGKAIKVYPPILHGNVALIEINDVVWPDSNFTARGALCYNASKSGLPAIFVLDFGANRSANMGNFVVRFPGPDPASAILRIT